MSHGSHISNASAAPHSSIRECCTVSHGCITVNNARRNRDSEWKLIKQLISTTTVSKVPKRERLQKYIPFTNRLKYGTIYVR